MTFLITIYLFIFRDKICSKLKLKFRGGYKDIVFSFNSPECTFDVALTLINNTISSPIDINGIKQGLIRKYQELFAMYPTEIINLFDCQCTILIVLICTAII